MKIEDEDYKKMLLNIGFDKSVVGLIILQRGLMEYCSNEMFDELVRQGLVKQTRVLKKKRSLYVDSDGKIMYLDYYHKKYNYCGYFIN